MEYKTTGDEKVLIYKCNAENIIFCPSLEQQTINCSKCIGGKFSILTPIL